MLLVALAARFTSGGIDTLIHLRRMR